MDWFNDDASWKDWVGATDTPADSGSVWDSTANLASQNYPWFDETAGVLSGAYSSGLGGGGALSAPESLFGGVGSALGGVYDWYQGSGPGTQGLINSALLGSAQAYANARAADKQRDYERTLTEEQREYNRKMRTIPKNISVGSAANFQGKS